MMDWRIQGQGPQWVPVLNVAEEEYRIPHDLLARLAYEESHFREDVIRGETHSQAGALGMMQLMPNYFETVNVPIPFTNTDVGAQIEEAALFLQHLYQKTNSWKLAVAAYNAGLGAVRRYNGVPPYTETVKYVAEISRDVPEAFA